MIYKIINWIINKKDPCKKCLVGPVCKRDLKCETLARHIEFKKRIDILIEKIADTIIIGGIIMAFASFAITFILGLYKWYEILSLPVRKWLF